MVQTPCALCTASCKGSSTTFAGVVIRDCDGYRKTHGFEVTGFVGMGTVADFGTPWHTTYPYHSIAGIQWVYYNMVSIFFIVLKLVFSHI